MTEYPERWWVQQSPFEPTEVEVVSNMPTGLDDPEDVKTHRGHFVAGCITSPERARAIALLPELLEEVAKALKPYDQDTKMMCMFPELRRVYNLAMGIEETKVEIPDANGTNQEGSTDPK